MFLMEDGYTLPFTVETEAGTITGTYRPPLFETHQSFLHRFNRAISGEEEVKITVEYIAERLHGWDVVKKTPGEPMPAPPDAAHVRKLPPLLVNGLLNEVSQWKPKPQAEAAGN